MVSKNRMINLFTELVRYDSESFGERKIGKYVEERLKALGLELLTKDGTDPAFLEAHPDSYPNIHARLKGTGSGKPVLFSAHLDTVSPGKRKQFTVTDDGVIRSAGHTVLGADDISGIVSIIEALTVIREENLKHPDIEVLITAAEEPFCEGSRYFRFDRIRARTAYVLDLTGPVGTAAVGAPSIVTFRAEILGRAAHAGFAPETGINALEIAVKTLGSVRTGRVDEYTTVNFGTITGGTADNVVPERVRISGEVRSIIRGEAERIADRILERFAMDAGEAGGDAFCDRMEHIRAYQVAEDDPAVLRFRKACRLENIPCSVIRTMGGSDANRLNEAGIRTIVIACGMENVHSTEEFCKLSELNRSAKLTLRLMTMESE